MSSATARANPPVRATRSDHSTAELGLPWTNTTASEADSGPASSSRVRTPSTTSSRSRGGVVELACAIGAANSMAASDPRAEFFSFAGNWPTRGYGSHAVSGSRSLHARRTDGRGSRGCAQAQAQAAQAALPDPHEGALLEGKLEQAQAPWSRPAPGGPAPRDPDQDRLHEGRAARREPQPQ